MTKSSEILSQGANFHAKKTLVVDEIGQHAMVCISEDGCSPGPKQCELGE